MPKRKKKTSKLDSAKLVDYMSIALVVLLGLVVLNKNTAVRDGGEDVVEDVASNEVVEEEDGETVDVESDAGVEGEVLEDSSDELSARDGVVEDFVALNVFADTEDMVAALDDKIAGYFDDSATSEIMIAATETEEREVVEAPMSVGVSVLPESAVVAYEQEKEGGVPVPMAASVTVLPESAVVAYEQEKEGGVPVPMAASVTVLPEGVASVVTAKSDTDIATAQMAVGVTVLP